MPMRRASIYLTETWKHGLDHTIRSTVAREGDGEGCKKVKGNCFVFSAGPCCADLQHSCTAVLR